MRIPLDHVVGQPPPMLRAIEPVLHAARGDFGQADKKLREAADVLQVMPWREPVHLYVISYVARLPPPPPARGDRPRGPECGAAAAAQCLRRLDPDGPRLHRRTLDISPGD